MDISGNASWHADSVNSFHCSVGRHPQMPVPWERPSLGWTQNCSQVVGRRCDYSGLLLQLFCAWGMCLFACSEFRSTISPHVHSVRVTEVFQLGPAISESGSERQEEARVGFQTFRCLPCMREALVLSGWPTRMKHPCRRQFLCISAPPHTHTTLAFVIHSVTYTDLLVRQVCLGALLFVNHWATGGDTRSLHLMDLTF